MIRAWIEYYLLQIWGFFAPFSYRIWEWGRNFDIRISDQLELWEQRGDFGWPTQEITDWSDTDG